jgi:uncharacterized protein (TIGR00266 family)
MKLDILHQPDSSIAKIEMAPNEEIVAEAGAMVAMSSNLDVSTTLRKGKGGGVLGGLKRMMAGESLFLSVFRTPNEAGEIYLAPKLLIVQSTGYLASTPGVDLELGFQGFKSFFSGESIFWLKISGSGLVLLNAFGGIYEIDVDGEYVVDTGHIVAFEESLNFRISKANASWWGAIFGGEGLVCRFSGKGKLYCQTHNPKAFGAMVGSLLPPR